MLMGHIAMAMVFVAFITIAYLAYKAGDEESDMLKS